MASISSPGLGSGLDVNTIVSQLVAIERRPLALISEEKASLQSKLSAFGLIKSYTVNVQDAVAKLADASLWTKNKAVTTESSLTVSATSAAVKGDYRIGVTQLAQAQALASAPYASSTSSVGTGTLTIELGTWAEDLSGFTPRDGATAVEIEIEAGKDSLESVRDAINAAHAGVTASIVRDAGGARLVITSDKTGEENGFRITVDPTGDPDSPSLADLAYDPASAPPMMTRTITARDAIATVNGLEVRSTTNTFDDVIEGLRFTATKELATPATVSVSLDTDAMRSAINTFLSAYNDLAKYIATQTRYDADTKTAGALQGDRATLSVLSQLRSVITAGSGASSAFRTASSLGIEIQRDGTLKLNETAFAKAMEQPAEVAKAFAASGSVNKADDGLAVRMKAMAAALLGTDGVVNTRSEGLRSVISTKDKQIAAYEDRLARTEARLLNQFTALDSKLGTLNALNAYITQQVTLWNNQKKS